MPAQISTSGRNGMLDGLEAAIGANPIVRIRTGPPPANPAAARSGTVLATITTAADPFSNASGGVKTLLGTWQDAATDASGDPGHFEIMDSAGTTCHFQSECAAPWQANRNYSLGACVTNDSGKVYRCTTAGVAAASGGPTGTGATIADNAAVWAYIGASALAIGALTVDAPITAGQSLNVNAFTLTAPNG